MSYILHMNVQINMSYKYCIFSSLYAYYVIVNDNIHVYIDGRDNVHSEWPIGERTSTYAIRLSTHMER
jgi:hypothetical protein